MQFTIDKEILKRELGIVQGVVERKQTIPVLSNIIIQATDDGYLRFTGTDLDVTINGQIKPSVLKEPGAMCLNARKLFDIVKTAPDAPLSFKSEENQWATIRADTAKFRVPGVDPASFPEVPPFREQGKVILDGTHLMTAIPRNTFAITDEAGRYTLSGVKLEITKGKMIIVATDGHRLTLVEHPYSDASVNFDNLIPEKAIDELHRMLMLVEKDRKDDDANAMNVEFNADENHVYFRVGGRLLISRLLSGQFPNYEMVIPKMNDQQAALDTRQVAAMLRRADVMADDRSHAVKIVLGKGELEISSQDAETGMLNETVACDYQGDAVTIGINGKYLSEFLSVVGTEQVVMKFKDGNTQLQFEPQSEVPYKYLCVIMPLRL